MHPVPPQCWRSGSAILLGDVVGCRYWRFPDRGIRTSQFIDQLCSIRLMGISIPPDVKLMCLNLGFQEILPLVVTKINNNFKSVDFFAQNYFMRGKIGNYVRGTRGAGTYDLKARRTSDFLILARFRARIRQYKKVLRRI